MVKIASHQETTIDYPGKMGEILFLKDCNFKCGFCHNPELINKNQNEINQDALLKNIKSKVNSGWYNGIIISGGEPTIYSDLPDFIKILKDMNLSVKLDTNGSNPQMLKKLLEEKLIDYIAMDIKSPRHMYANIVNVKKTMGHSILKDGDYDSPLFLGCSEIKTGLQLHSKECSLISDIKDNIAFLIDESMNILSNSKINYEFRTTIFPVYKKNEDNNENKISWMNNAHISDIAKWISKASGKNSNYYIQKFVARKKDEMLDEKFSKDVLPKEYHETPIDILETLKDEAKKYLPNTKVR